MALGAVVVEDLDRRRPLRAEAFEGLRLLFDVDFHGKVVGIDKALNARVGVDLGIQPSAGPSHWGRVKINQQRALARSCLLKRVINIRFPGNRHKFLLSKKPPACR
jgi:hypothetical protein